MRMRVHKSTFVRGARRKENHFCWPKLKNEWNKWKNHYYEMKGAVGMSLHEKEKEQEDAYTKTQSHS